MITSRTPKLDLHGEECALANSLVVEFLKDNYRLNNKELLIIHGKSTNILTKEVHQILKRNSLVDKYKLDGYNVGETIVYLK